MNDNINHNKDIKLFGPRQNKPFIKFLTFCLQKKMYVCSM